MSRFYVGQPVICVNDSFKWARFKFPGVVFPRAGCRYVIRAYVHLGDFPAVVLMEMRNRKVRYMDGSVQEAGFWDERFAPATNIEDLEKLLTTTSKEKEHEDA